MTKQKAIRKFCMDCASSWKDVALCTAPECALWEWRLGQHLRSKLAIKTMTMIFKRFPKDIEELESYGVDPEKYLPRKPRVSRSPLAGVAIRRQERR